MKKKLVFICGGGIGAKMWQPQREYFGEDYEVIIPAIYKYDSVAIMAQEVIRTNPSADCLIGLSLGGITAQYVMHLNPNYTKKLVLLGTWAHSPSKVLQDGCSPLIQQLKNQTLTLETMSQNMLSAEMLSNKMKNLAIQAILDIETNGVVNGINAFINAPDVSANLSKITAQTIVLYGQNDETAPLDEQKLISNNIPNAKLITIENCSHLISLSQSEKLNQLLKDFIEN